MENHVFYNEKAFYYEEEFYYEAAFRYNRRETEVCSAILKQREYITNDLRI